MNLVFFGSFQHYSAKILGSLVASRQLRVTAVVTTLASPVATLAATHHLPIFTPSTLDEANLLSVISHLSSPCDIFVTAGYGKLLPPAWLSYPKQGALNLHFSLLPKYRGANPAEWAILLGETETGITLIKMAEKFDTGAILAQSTLTITPEDTRETLYEKLYDLGAKELPEWLLDFSHNHHIPGQTQGSAPTPYAAKFSRDDGFIDWRIIQAAISNETPDMSLLTSHLKTAFDFQLVKPGVFIERASRALAGFPSLWTIVRTKKGPKRMKIISCRGNHDLPLQLDMVQLEGYNPSTFNQIKNQITL